MRAQLGRWGRRHRSRAIVPGSTPPSRRSSTHANRSTKASAAKTGRAAQCGPHHPLASAVQRAIACNGRRQLWQIWHREQRGIYNLHTARPATKIKSHPGHH